MKVPHKHAALIKEWADGAEIQVYTHDDKWEDAIPYWNPADTYRVKPKLEFRHIAVWKYPDQGVYCGAPSASEEVVTAQRMGGRTPDIVVTLEINPDTMEVVLGKTREV